MKYNIKIYDTEEDKELGLSYLHAVKSKKSEAIKEAKKVFSHSNMACIEVETTDGEKVFIMNNEMEDEGELI